MSVKPTDLLFVMGPTNVGKSFIVEHAADQYSGHKVMVGKILREKYNPDFFKGEQAPEHTSKESLRLMIDGIQEGIDDKKPLIVVDGQPREFCQLEKIFNLYIEGELKESVDVYFLLLHCSEDIRKSRLEQRDMDEKELQLSKDRFSKDIDQLQSLFYEILRRGYGHRIFPIDTESKDSFDDFYKMLDYNRFKIK